MPDRRLKLWQHCQRRLIVWGRYVNRYRGGVGDVWHKDSIGDFAIRDRYKRSLYWGITTIVMVGYDDGTAGLDSPWEVPFTNLVLMFG